MRETAATIRQISVAEAFASPEFAALCREYARESSIVGLPDPQEKLSAYQALEAAGNAAFCAYGAFVGGRGRALPVADTGGCRGAKPPDGFQDALVGFAVLLTPTLPHYGAVVAVAESLFVAAAHRKSGAGLLLIRQAEKRAREAGSPGLLFSAPSGGRLATLLPRIGYRETNRVFMKGFAHD